MGNIADQQRAIEELRGNSVEKLLNIFDELEGMSLSLSEIEVVLKTCGINVECAVMLGASMKVAT